MYFASAGWQFPWRIIGGGVHHGGWHISVGGGTFHGGGFDFGPYLVDGCQVGGGGHNHGGWQAKPKVLLLVKPLELQHYLTTFSKAAK